MRFNASPINDVALDDVSPRETFGGIFGRLYQSVTESRVAGPIVNFQQSVGISRGENVFIIFDQNVQLRSLTGSGPFVTFYQNVKETSNEQNIVILNQKVMP